MVDRYFGRPAYTEATDGKGKNSGKGKDNQPDAKGTAGDAKGKADGKSMEGNGKGKRPGAAWCKFKDLRVCSVCEFSDGWRAMDMVKVAVKPEADNTAATPWGGSANRVDTEFEALDVDADGRVLDKKNTHGRVHLCRLLVHPRKEMRRRAFS